MVKTFKLQSGSMCEVRCYMEHNCVSYNLGAWDEDGAYRCELSNSDHDTHPKALVRQKGVTYRSSEVSLVLEGHIVPMFTLVHVKSCCVGGKWFVKWRG